MWKELLAYKDGLSLWSFVSVNHENKIIDHQCLMYKDDEMIACSEWDVFKDRYVHRLLSKHIMMIDGKMLKVDGKLVRFQGNMLNAIHLVGYEDFNAAILPHAVELSKNYYYRGGIAQLTTRSDIKGLLHVAMQVPKGMLTLQKLTAQSILTSLLRGAYGIDESIQELRHLLPDEIVYQAFGDVPGLNLPHHADYQKAIVRRAAVEIVWSMDKNKLDRIDYFEGIFMTTGVDMHPFMKETTRNRHKHSLRYHNHNLRYPCGKLRPWTGPKRVGAVCAKCEKKHVSSPCKFCQISAVTFM